MTPEQLDHLLTRLDALLDRAERLLPDADPDPGWTHHIAWRWRRDGARAHLEPVRHPHRLALADLRCIDRQKAELARNTRQFIDGRPANNALLWGSRGTGKSSLIKALLHEHALAGLRLIEVDKHHLMDLPDIVDRLWDRPERFIVFCDDLAFAAAEPGYQALKAILDGSISAPPDNVLIYATSNRRHLMPEYLRENREARMVDEEIHHGEAVEEKISLSERFGLWLSFYPFKQAEYLTIVAGWLAHLGVDARDAETLRREALQWALARGSRSGRVALQFAKDWAARHG
jgi:predicted AAA+ superfamily ATPase